MRDVPPEPPMAFVLSRQDRGEVRPLLRERGVSDGRDRSFRPGGVSLPAAIATFVTGAGLGAAVAALGPEIGLVVSVFVLMSSSAVALVLAERETP